jgi:hypothetical protein
MNTMTTWTDAPAGLFGLGGSGLRRCADLADRVRIGVSPAPRVAPFQGTGAPAGAVWAGIEPVAHNYIGTTLGIHPSRRRPQS